MNKIFCDNPECRFNMPVSNNVAKISIPILENGGFAKKIIERHQYQSESGFKYYFCSECKKSLTYIEIERITNGA